MPSLAFSLVHKLKWELVPLGPARLCAPERVGRSVINKWAGVLVLTPSPIGSLAGSGG